MSTGTAPGAAAPRKRFYTEARAAAGETGWHVALDGRPVRTPSRKLLAVPGRALAEAVAAEWAGQGEFIDPVSMPLTRLVNTARDGVETNAAAVADEVVRYAGSDLLCYRAPDPARLVQLQAQLWDPVLAWAQETLGARFVLSEGVMHVTQPEASMEAVRAALPDDPLELAAVSLMTTLSGSVLLALAVRAGRLDAAAAWRAAHIDEETQEERWGRDEEAHQRRQARWRDFEAGARLLELLRA